MWAQEEAAKHVRGTGSHNYGLGCIENTKAGDCAQESSSRGQCANRQQATLHRVWVLTVLTMACCSSSRYLVSSERVLLSQIRYGFSVLLFNVFNSCVWVTWIITWLLHDWQMHAPTNLVCGNPWDELGEVWCEQSSDDFLNRSILWSRLLLTGHCKWGR